jgi:hypothetical protein
LRVSGTASSSSSAASRSCGTRFHSCGTNFRVRRSSFRACRQTVNCAERRSRRSDSAQWRGERESRQAEGVLEQADDAGAREERPSASANRASRLSYRVDVTGRCATFEREPGDRRSADVRRPRRAATNVRASTYIGFLSRGVCSRGASTLTRAASRRAKTRAIAGDPNGHRQALADNAQLLITLDLATPVPSVVRWESPSMDGAGPSRYETARFVILTYQVFARFITSACQAPHRFASIRALICPSWETVRGSAGSGPSVYESE